MPPTTIFEVPQGYNVVGTCGACGGPVLQSQTWANYGTAFENPPPRICSRCGKNAKPEITPAHGPILPMV